ncbi:MAG: carboxypeptidase-like regulatory domain-containing protein, partial [Bacteroidota bacterium]
MKKYLIGFIALFTAFSIQAQEMCTVSGVVKDEEAGLPFASVQFDKKGAFTDANGDYSIELPYGEYTVTASFIGLEDQVKTVTLDSPSLVLNFMLSARMMDQVDIITDLIVDRSTPVPVSN